MTIPDLAGVHSSMSGVIGGRNLPLVPDRVRMNLQVPEPPLTLNLEAVIRNHVHFVLERNRGNKLKTARQLGISRSTLYRMLDGELRPSREIPQSTR
jgi:transcriptional regulator with PAS, ATPase and Fis domain